MHISEELRAEAITFFHEARQRKAEEAGDDKDQGDNEEEVVLIKLPVANPYTSKPKKKQLAKVFRITDGSYKGGDTWQRTSGQYNRIIC